MSYIGRQPTVGNFQICDAISVVNGQAAYTMQVGSVNVLPETANHMIVSLNGVIQKPNSSFTVSGSTITFSSNLVTNDVIDFIQILGDVLDLGVPSDATVTNAKTNFVSTSSAAGLQIKGDGTTDGTLQLNCSQNSHGIKIKSPPHSASASYTLTMPNNDGDANQVLTTNGSGVLSFAAATISGNVTTIDSIFKTDLKIGEDDQTKIDFETANEIHIDTNNAERMRIDSAGTVRMLSDNLGANPSSSNQGITFRNNGSTARTIELGISATGNSTVVNFINGNGGVGTIQLNGSATAYNTSSDYRLKENVDYTFDATTRLKQLKPARFNFIADDTKTVDGFIAHEVSSIVPEAISGEKDAVKVWKDDEELPEGVSVGDNKLDADGNTIMDIQGIDQSKLVPLLVKTIQELEARITALENA